MKEGDNIPKTREKLRKLKALSKGKGVRAPKRWFDLMKKRVKKQYPNLGMKRRDKIVGGIWSKSSIATKKKVINKYQR